MVSLGGLARKVFGSSNDRRVKSTAAPCRGDQRHGKRDASALRRRAASPAPTKFRQDIANGATLDDLLVPAFATVREAARRVLGMRPFDVQLIGGMVLHNGGIAEMRTGEGKTLVATLPVYLNALAGKGVHVVTVNDYLATRDSEWMGRVYKFLGLTVGVIVHGLSDEERRVAYAADVTYATNNELGFDYLRDNMKYERAQMVQRGHNYAIVDEVNSILVDEARTPLIISGPLEDRSEMYNTIDTFIIQLQPQDYEIDEKQKTSIFTEEGTEKLENLLRDAGLLKGESLYDVENVAIVHHVNNALKAHRLFQRDKDYIVRNGEIVIIDEFTGRMMPGRRYSEGLHQALEAKEHVAIQPENQTLASVTFQNYFRLYKKLAGMTGTALTEAEEFGNIYNLDVTEIPTNLPVIRIDEDDEVYRTVEEKYKAIVKEIREASAKGQPIAGRHHLDREIRAAGRAPAQGRLQGLRGAERPPPRAEAYYRRPGRHAGRHHHRHQHGRPRHRHPARRQCRHAHRRRARPTCRPAPSATAKEKAIREDVQRLKEKALAAGGLYVLATERHESRRIDNQLRGRSGRQGDPGRSKFFLSLQDDLMRIFGSERMDGMLQKLGLKEDEAIIHPWINKALEKAQKKVEARNFDIRKNLLKYDDVMNDQRKVVFEQRIELMDGEGLSEIDRRDARGRHRRARRQGTSPKTPMPSSGTSPASRPSVAEFLNLDLPVEDWVKEEGIAEDDIRERITQAADAAATDRAERFGPDVMTYVERSVVLQTLDHLWREHIVNLDHLRSVVGFRGYAQRDPLQRVQGRGVRAVPGDARQSAPGRHRAADARRAGPPGRRSAAAGGARHVRPPYRRHHRRGRFRRRRDRAAGPRRRRHAVVAPEERDPKNPATWGKVGRNEACPCGSGKKYKHCHGAFA